MKNFLKSLFWSLVVPGLFVAIFALVAFYFADKLDKKEKEVIAANDGYGSSVNPLPMSRDIQFEKLTLRIKDYINPANHRISEISGFNGNADPTVKYVMLWIEGDCSREMCYGADVIFAAIDDKGNKIRALNHGLIDDLAADSARYGRDLKGWVAFEIPYDSELRYFEIIFSQVALYIEIGE